MNDAAAHRRRALDAIVFAFDANLMLSKPALPAHRSDALRARRDKAIEEAVDELLLALPKEKPKSG